MLWITFILGSAIGTVLGDMLNHKTFKELFIIGEDTNRKGKGNKKEA